MSAYQIFDVDAGSDVPELLNVLTGVYRVLSAVDLCRLVQLAISRLPGQCAMMANSSVRYFHCSHSGQWKTLIQS